MNIHRKNLLVLLNLSTIVIAVTAVTVSLITVSRVKAENLTSENPSKPVMVMNLSEPTPIAPSEINTETNSESGLSEITLRPSGASEARLSPQVEWPKYWYAVLGAVFQPANSGYSYQYGNSGCLKSNSPGYWRTSVNLPDNSVAKYLYIIYKNDMNSANSTAYFTRYKIDGNYNDLISVSSRNYTTTGIGYYIDLSSEFTETIDNLSYGYTFIWSGSTTQRLCSIKLGYYPPTGYGAGLPLLLNQP